MDIFLGRRSIQPLRIHFSTSFESDIETVFLCPTNSGTLIRGPLKIVFPSGMTMGIPIEGAVSETPDRSKTSTSASQTSEGFLSAAALSIAL